MSKPMDGRHIAKRPATLEQVEEALAAYEHGGQEYAARELRKEIDLLRPYWQHPGVTKEQAVAAYHVDHPEETGKGEM